MSLFVSCFIALLAQTTFLHVLRFREGVVSAVMIPLVLAVHLRKPYEALMIGGMCGFAEDVVCGTGFAWTVATAMALLVVNRVAQMIAVERVLFAVVVISAATLLRDVLFWSIERVSSAPFVLFMHDIHMSLWNALLTGIAAFVFVRPLQRFFVPAKRSRV